MELHSSSSEFSEATNSVELPDSSPECPEETSELISLQDYSPESSKEVAE